jgi:hypothetical protein
MSNKFAWIIVIFWISGGIICSILDPNINIPIISDNQSIFSMLPYFQEIISWAFKVFTWNFSFFENYRIFYWLVAFPFVLTGLLELLTISIGLLNGIMVGLELRNKPMVVNKHDKAMAEFGLKSQAFEQYHNNLDELLGIKTIPEPYYNTFGSFEEKLDGLNLRGNSLFISDNYDWFIIEKHSEQDIFKIAGLNKKDDKKDKTYLLGILDGEPFLKNVNDKNKSIEELLNESKDSNMMSLVFGALSLVVATSMFPSVNDSVEELAKRK